MPIHANVLVTLLPREENCLSTVHSWLRTARGILIGATYTNANIRLVWRLRGGGDK